MEPATLPGMKRKPFLGPLLANPRNPCRPLSNKPGQRHTTSRWDDIFVPLQRERNPPSKRVGLVGSHRECPQIHALFVSSPHSSAKFTATTLIQLGTRNTDQSLHKSGKLAPYASETRILAWNTRVRLVRTPRASTYESRRPVLA